MEDMELKDLAPTQPTPTEAAFNFLLDGGALVTIQPDGTVIIHKEGADKQAAQAFWGAMGNELKKIEQRLIWERDQWKNKYEDLKDALCHIFEDVAHETVPPNTGLYKGDDNAVHACYKGKQLF